MKRQSLDNLLRDADAVGLRAAQGVGTDPTRLAGEVIGRARRRKHLRFRLAASLVLIAIVGGAGFPLMPARDSRLARQARPLHSDEPDATNIQAEVFRLR